MGFVEGIERMKELFLRPLFARQKLNVVDHQHIDVAIPLTQVDHLVITNRIDDFVRKLLGRQVGDAEVAPLGQVVADRIQQVGLAQSHTTIEKQGL